MDKTYVENHNKIIIESMMEKTLTAMCDKVKLKYLEWDVGPDLYDAIIECPNFGELEDLARQFDDYYDIAETFKVRHKLNTKFIWFKDLFKNNKTKNNKTK